MIQLRSALVELGRVEVDPRVSRPTWQRDEGVRELLDGGIRAKLLADKPLAGGKALVIGGAWPLLALDLARMGLFVTVVDPDPEVIRAVSAEAASAKLLTQITVQALDYKDINFAASAFNVIVAWDSLNAYTEQLPLLKKINRELKAGGRLFLRAWVAAETLNRTLMPGGRRLLRSLLALAPGVDPDVVADDSFLTPWAFALDRVQLLAEVESLLVVREVTYHHRLVADFADVVAHVAPALKPTLSLLQLMDQKLVEARPELARFVAIDAVREKQLGRVFRTS